MMFDDPAINKDDGPKSYYSCPSCNSFPLINLKEKSIKCPNEHKFKLEDDTFDELFSKMTKLDPSDIPCSECSNKKANFYCFDDDKYYCSNNTREFNSIEISKLHDHCKYHRIKNAYFCEKHNENYCGAYENIHSNCENQIKLEDIKPKQDEVDSLLNSISKYRTEFNKEVNMFLSRFRKCRNEINAEYSLYETILNTYNNIKDNYFLIKNVNELLGQNWKDKWKLINIDKQIEEIKKISSINDITITINITNDTLNKDIYFLCDQENNTADFTYDELNNDNCRLYIDEKQCEFKKYAKFTTTGEHTIRLRISKHLKSMFNMFYECRNLTKIDLSYLNTREVTSMKGTFDHCYELLEIIGLEKIDTSNVTNTSFMFNGCQKIKTLDCRNFNMKNVTDMNTMFQCCYELEEIKGLSAFNTENVTEMSYLFNKCYKMEKLDLENFNFTKVTNIEYIFGFCRELKTLILNGNINPTCTTNDMFVDNYRDDLEIKVKGGDVNHKIRLLHGMTFTEF